MSELPLLSLTTSSAQVRTMPFLVTTRCAETSAQPTSGTTSPFNFMSPGDGIVSPGLDSKHDDCQVPTTTSVNASFILSQRREILSEESSMSGVQATHQLYRGSSFESGGAETGNSTQSSGTSAGSSQPSDGRRQGTAVQAKDEFSHSQSQTPISAGNDHDQNTKSGTEPSTDAGLEWGSNQQTTPVVMTEQSTVHQIHTKERKVTVKTLEVQEAGSAHDHQLESEQSAFLLDRNPKEEQNSTFSRRPSDRLGTSAESVPVYQGESTVTQSTTEIFPTYSTMSCLLSSDSYNFPTGAELLGVPTQIQITGNSSRGSGPNSLQDEAGPFGNINGAVTLFPSQNLGRRLEYSGPSLKGSWTGMATQYTSSSQLLNSNVSVQNNLQVMSPLGTPDPSQILSENLQHNSYSHDVEPHNRDGTSYFSSPQPQTESAMRSCLNPRFAGPRADLEVSPPPGNLLHMSNTGVHQLDIHGSHSQQHFLSIPLPPAALAQSALAERSHLLAHQGISAVPGSHIVGNQGYSNWRNGGNELLFLSGSDSTVHTQPFSGQVSAQLQQAELAISQYGSRRSPTLSSANQVPQHSFFQNGDGSSPTGPIGNCQFQGLSLSLSSEQPSSLQLHIHPNHGGTEADIAAVISQASAEAKGKREEGTHGNESRYNGILSRFRSQRDDQDLAISAAAQRLHNYGHPAEGIRRHPLLVNSSRDPFPASGSSVSYACKYLKLSQILLNEICVVSKCERRTASRDHRRAQEHSGWSTDQPSSASASNCLVRFHPASRGIVGADSGRKDFMPNLTIIPGTASSITDSRGREVAFETHVQPDNRGEADKKKSRLGTFLDEVDMRYRAYSEHMMDVISQFNSIAGPEAATPYTALALQAMSRHFRCLRDAVSAQLRTVKRFLGDQDTSPRYAGRDVSSFRSLEQLRQHRALQQLGMLQQHAWRPQRGLPERAVSVLRSWLFEHFLHPYPKDSDKLFLAKQTGLTRSQVSNWFINARVRLWKPMVEEMYLEEFSNSDEGFSGERNLPRERRREHESIHYDNVNIGSRFSNGHAEARADKQHQITIATGGDRTFPHPSFLSAHGSNQNDLAASSLDFDADQRATGILKKARNGIHHSDHLASSVSGMEIDSGSPGSFHDPCRLDGNYGSSAEQHYDQHQDILAASNPGRFNSYMGGTLAGHPGTSFVSRATASTISLTLGLRHSDGLSLSGTVAPQQKYSNQGHHSSQRQKYHDHFDTGVQDDEVRNMNSNLHSEPPSQLNPSQDGLKQRNRIPSHLLHEFVGQG